MTAPLRWITTQVWRSWQPFSLSGISTSSLSPNTWIHYSFSWPWRTSCSFSGKTRRHRRQPGLQSLHSVTITHTLGNGDTERLTLLVYPLWIRRDCKDTFATIRMYSLIMTCLIQGAFYPWCRALWKNSYIHCLKTEFLNKGWEKPNKTTIKLIKSPIPCQICHVWLTVRSFIVLVQTNSFPKLYFTQRDFIQICN